MVFQASRSRKWDVILFIHGAISDENMWQPHMRLLQNDYDTVAITLSHFDGRKGSPFGVQTHASEVCDFLRVLPRDKSVHLVGWSYGADVALEVLGRASGRIASAFLYEPGSPIALAGPRLCQWLDDAEQVFGKVRDFSTKGELTLATEALVDGTAVQAGYFQNQTPWLRNYWLSKSHTIPSQLAMTEPSELNSSVLGGIQSNVSFLYGTSSRDMFKLATVSLQEKIHGSELRAVQGAGHMLPVDEPGFFVSCLSRHLRSLQLAQSQVESER